MALGLPEDIAGRHPESNYEMFEHTLQLQQQQAVKEYAAQL
jgi:hypothetical protein